MTLWVSNKGIAATCMYTKWPTAIGWVLRCKAMQVTWLPCEIKALTIATAIKHIIKHVHIIQSSHLMVVLTVSSPCVHANEKLKREEFSTSSRATTFLSTVCHYFVYVLLIAGVENFPSDFGSRGYLESSCQNCMCLVELENSIVRSISVSEVLMAL